MIRPSLFRDLARVCRTDAEHSPSMAQWDHLHEVAQRWDARADALEEEMLLGSDGRYLGALLVG